MSPTATIRTNMGTRSRRSATTPDLWPLRNERDYARMRQLADQLILREDLPPEQTARLEIMLTLMESYEDKHHCLDIAGKKPLDALRFLLEQNEMSASDLGRLLGNRTLGSAILRGKRDLSKSHIKKLAERFAVEPGLFL